MTRSGTSTWILADHPEGNRTRGRRCLRTAHLKRGIRGTAAFTGSSMPPWWDTHRGVRCAVCGDTFSDGPSARRVSGERREPAQVAVAITVRWRYEARDVGLDDLLPVFDVLDME